MFCPTIINIHFFKPARKLLLPIYFQSALRWHFVLGLREYCLFLWHASLPRMMFLRCFLFFLEAVPCIFRPACWLWHFDLQITSPSPLRIGSWYEQLDYHFYSWRCLPTDFLLFCALVPDLLQRVCFARAFSSEFVLFCVAVSFAFRLTSFRSAH